MPTMISASTTRWGRRTYEDSDDSAVEDYYRYRHYESDGEEESDRYRQGVTKRCRLSLLTNRTLDDFISPLSVFFPQSP